VSYSSSLRQAEGAAAPPPARGAAGQPAIEGLPQMTRTADILVVAVGYPRLVKRSWVKPGAVVIDVGINVVGWGADGGGGGVPGGGAGAAGGSGRAAHQDLEPPHAVEAGGEGPAGAAAVGGAAGTKPGGGEEPQHHFHVVGDVDFADVEGVASAITPVPGGVGPMTIAAVLHNTLAAAWQGLRARRL
jgi:hypothetical protein